MGVIEIGASGLNAFIITVDETNNYKVDYKEFGESLALEGFATYDDVKEGLKTYLSKIFIKGVSGNNIYFVVSSGALKNNKTKILVESIKKMGHDIIQVNPEQEAKYLLIALLPTENYNDSFVVDMGSGNTKISYIDSTNTIISFETYGSKYYQDESIVEDSIQNNINKIINKIPSQNKQNMFIIGGVPYELAKKVCTKNRYVLLKKPENYFETNDNIKFNSGLKLYDYIYSTSKPQQVIFDYDVNFTMGYLLNQK